MSIPPELPAWLLYDGHEPAARAVQLVLDKWRRRGAKTRRNWWDVLAGDSAGNPRTIEGVEFPVLAIARKRKGLPSVPWAIATTFGKNTPSSDARRTRPKAASSTRGRKESAFDNAQVPSLTIKNFAQIESVEVPLRDLVVLVGPQATGKSLVLEMLKLAIDRNRIVRSLKQHGLTWNGPNELVALYFGGGFENSWTKTTRVVHIEHEISIRDLTKARAYKGEDAVFYIPAHRTLAIAEGWPRPFAQYQIETPFVARRFSEQLLTSLNQGLVGKGKIFPHDRRLKDAFRRLIDESIFHGATLRLDTARMRKQFVLEYGTSNDSVSATLPFMTWTAGQREFTPMLLGLYHLLPPGNAPKKKEIQWAIVEEPEMGLHPKGIVAVMAVVLDLLARGYKVAISTHSPTVLEVVWGMSRLREHPQGPERLCKMMGLPHRDKKVLKTAAEALKKTHAVVHLQHSSNGKVLSKDISRLDPGSPDPREWGWGGLTGFSARVAEAIASTRG